MLLQTHLITAFCEVSFKVFIHTFKYVQIYIAVITLHGKLRSLTFVYILFIYSFFVSCCFFVYCIYLSLLFQLFFCCCACCCCCCCYCCCYRCRCCYGCCFFFLLVLLSPSCLYILDGHKRDPTNIIALYIFIQTCYFLGRDTSNAFSKPVQCKRCCWHS